MQTDTILFRETTAVIGWLLFLILQSCIFLSCQLSPVLPRNYSLTTDDKQKIRSLKNYNHFPYCQLKCSSSKQPHPHVISTYSVYENKAVATITNVVLPGFQLMIRLEGTGRGGGGGGEEKGELHVCFPSSEKSLLSIVHFY